MTLIAWSACETCRHTAAIDSRLRQSCADVIASGAWQTQNAHEHPAGSGSYRQGAKFNATGTTKAPSYRSQDRTSAGFGSVNTDCSRARLPSFQTSTWPKHWTGMQSLRVDGTADTEKGTRRHSGQLRQGSDSGSLSEEVPQSP